MNRKILAYVCAVLLGASGMWLATPRPVSAQGTFAPFQCNNSVAVSATTGNTKIQAAANSGMFVYVCSFALNSQTAAQFSIIEGTGTNCGTNTVAVAGGTTAALGYGIGAAASPVAAGGGVGSILKTKTAGDDLCIIVTAGTSNLAGYFAVAQQNF